MNFRKLFMIATALEQLAALTLWAVSYGTGSWVKVESNSYTCYYGLYQQTCTYNQLVADIEKYVFLAIQIGQGIGGFLKFLACCFLLASALRNRRYSKGYYICGLLAGMFSTSTVGYSGYKFGSRRLGSSWYMALASTILQYISLFTNCGTGESDY